MCTRSRLVAAGGEGRGQGRGQEEQLQLLFSTQRPAAAYLLVGAIRAIAKQLYATEADIRLEGAEPASKDGRGGFRYR